MEALQPRVGAGGEPSSKPLALLFSTLPCHAHGGYLVNHDAFMSWVSVWMPYIVDRGIIAVSNDTYVSGLLYMSYVIFEVLDESKLQQVDSLYKEFDTPERANKM